MEKTARIEYGLKKNVISNLKSYPLIDKKVLDNVKSYTERCPAKDLLYAVMRSYKDKNYVDIYLFKQKKCRECVRFIIAIGEVLPIELEESFIRYMKSELQFFSENMIRLKQDVYEKWNIDLTQCEDCKICMLQLYFSTHRAGVLEILFKMKLYKIALEIDQIEGINYIGTKIEEIFQMPFKFFLMFNSDEKIKFIKRKDDRLALKNIYKIFHNFINREKIVTEYQLKYLYECYEGNIIFDKFLFREIANIQKENEWNSLMLYFENRNCIPVEYNKFLPMHPKLNKIERLRDICSFLIGYEIQKELYKKSMQERFSCNREKFQYQYDDWFVTGPESVYDLIAESFMQNNCLYTYIPRLLFTEETAILFMRKQSAPDKSWITLEVFGEEKIIQALRCHNEPINQSEYQVIQKFAQEKKLFLEL